MNRSTFSLFFLPRHFKLLTIHTFSSLSVEFEYKNGTTDDVWTILRRNIAESRIREDERASRSASKAVLNLRNAIR